MVATEDKKKGLESILDKLNKDFGAGAVMKLGEASKMKIERIPTGCLTLDLALGGGLPKGRVIEIYGPESSGKTSVMLHVIAATQKIGGVAAFVDAEHSLDPVYAKAIGVDIEELMICQPDTGEMGLEVTDQLVRSNAVDVVVVDSVAALVPRAEIEGEMGDAHMGLQARLMSQALRKITGSIAKSNCTVIFINQLRQKIGISYGNPEVTTGGNALKFYASVRLDIRRIQTLKKGTEEYAIRSKVKVAKNKTHPPFKIAEFDIVFGKGISQAGCIVDLAIEHGLVKKAGAWFKYKEESFQGKEKIVAMLEDCPDEAEELKSLIVGAVE